MKKIEDGIVSVSGRVVTFLFLFSVFILVMYLQGNFQDFLASSQIKLLEGYSTISMLFLPAGFFYIIILVLSETNKKRKKSLRIIMTSAAILVSAAGYIIASLILAMIKPVM